MEARFSKMRRKEERVKKEVFCFTYKVWRLAYIERRLFPTGREDKRKRFRGTAALL
jgi:hypothetical protein